MRLRQLASSGSSASKYRKLMKEVLEQDEAPNAVDNLMTKDMLTYAELKIQLHALSSNVVRNRNRNSWGNGTELVAIRG